jgi:two-component system sensor histidine kinase YesM
MSQWKWIKHFKNTSFKIQLQITFLATMIVILIVTLSMTLIWRNAYLEKTKVTAYKDISLLAKDTYEKLTAVERLSLNVIDNPTIQSLLTDFTQQDDNNTSITLKNQLIREVSQITRNSSNIRNIYLLSPEKKSLISFIDSKENVINQLSVDDLISDLPNYPAKGKWFFSDTLSQGVYVRKIFSSDNLSLNHIGTVIFFVDTTFFQLERQNFASLAENSFFLLDYENALYSPANQKGAQNFITEYDKIKSTLSGTFGITRLSEDSYYYVTADSPMDQGHFIYLIPESKILDDLYKLQWLFFLIFVPFLLIIIWGIHKMSNQLTRPITNLANQMLAINETKELKSLKTLALPVDPQKEIDILYNSYNIMIADINTLIKDNYEMRILSQEVEFKSLQSQLDPHFLYNTLDSINWLAIANNQPQIAEMVTSLAYLFRKKIDTNSEFVTLQDELDIVDAYIRIQKVRFDKRIEFIPLILVDNLSLTVPKLLIQPLIENAFKYAVSNMTSTCRLVLSVEMNHDNLWITVSDNGPGFKPNFSIEQESGIGLKNIQKRLTLHYGSTSRLQIVTSIPYKKTIVKFNIPLNKPQSQTAKESL